MWHRSLRSHRVRDTGLHVLPFARPDDDGTRIFGMREDDHGTLGLRQREWWLVGEVSRNGTEWLDMRCEEK
ncbi:hypothetical protein AB1N83_013950 [Pleurotus pulmonarius]